MRSLKSWFLKKPPADRRGAERVKSPWLAACDWSGSGAKRHRIRDISSTGVYLLGDERWKPGELLSISLLKNDQPEDNPGPGIPVQVRAVRSDADGTAFSFVQARDLDLEVGEGQHPDGVEHKEPESVRRKLHMAKASAFVDQICPSVSEDVKVLFRDRLSTFRVGNAVEIALKAERTLKQRPDAEEKRVSPKIVMRILEDGSWADDSSIQELWAGLLVASCTDDGRDESNLEFITLLSDLAAEHVHIFASACAKANVVMTEGASISSDPIVFTMEELVKITGLHDLSRIDVDIDHLAVFGLFEMRVKSSSYTSITDAVIKPSRLGLDLYARCHGHRGALREFYAGVCR